MTTCLQQQWPLKDENNKELILSSDLYWNYVFPYTSVDNRIIINKRTKNTKYYAGHRAELDSAFLDKHRDEPHISMNIVNFVIMKISGQGKLCMALLKEEPSLDVLRDVRRSWDELLSAIDSQSERLHRCLQMFYLREYPDNEIKFPLLFCGTGTVHDVVKLHSLMDTNSMNECLVPDPCRLFVDLSPDFPKTPLGIWLNLYLRFGYQHGMRDISIHFERIARALLEVEGINVDSFFEPLDIDISTPDSFYERTSHIYAFQIFRPGMSIVDCMKEYSNNISNQDVDWVIEKLEAAYKKNHNSLTP